MNRTAIDSIEAVAVGQHGVFTYEQALSVGVTRDMLRRQPRRWRRLAPAVYEVLAQPGDWRRPVMAAVLSLGPPAVVSHRTAALLLGLDGVRRGVVELSVAHGRACPGWRLHRREPPPVDRTATDGIPHTTPLRTLRDLCSVLDDDHVEMAIESALRLDLASLRQLDALARAPGWKGVTRLRRVLERRPPGAPATGSELETRFVQLARGAGLADPIRQHRVGVHGDVVARLDLAWPDVGLFVELDGSSHADPVPLLRDRQRQNDVVRLLGWRPLRFTWADVVDHPRTTERVLLSAFSRAVAV